MWTKNRFHVNSLSKFLFLNNPETYYFALINKHDCKNVGRLSRFVWNHLFIKNIQITLWPKTVKSYFKQTVTRIWVITYIKTSLYSNMFKNLNLKKRSILYHDKIVSWVLTVSFPATSPKFLKFLYYIILLIQFFW